MRRERFPVSRGRAGVEEIVGFAGSVGGLREWYGYAFGFPDRHPRLGRVRFSGCPLGAVGRPVCRVRIVSWVRGGLRTG